MEELREYGDSEKRSQLASLVRQALEDAGVDEDRTLTAKELKQSILALRRTSDVQGVGKDVDEQPQSDNEDSNVDNSGDIESPSSPGKQSNEEKTKEEIVNNIFEALSIDPNDHISGKDLIALTESLAKGELPKPELTLEGEELKEFQEASLYTKVTKFPAESIEYLRFHVLMQVSQKGTKWIKSLLPFHHFKTLFLFFIFTSMTKQFLLFSIPLILFYASMFSMVIYTLQMFYGKRLTKKFTNMQSLISTIDPLTRASLEKEWTLKSKGPYIGFFISCVIAASSYSMCDLKFIASSLLCISCFFFTVTTLRSYSASLGDLEVANDGLSILLLALRALSVLQTKMAAPILVFYQTDTMQVTITIISLLEAVALLGNVLLAIHVSTKSRDAGISVLLSTFVCFIWFQMGLQLFLSATWQGIFQIAVGWMLVLIAFPLMIFYLILQVGYIAYIYFMTFTISAKIIVSLTIVLMTTAVLIYTHFKKSGFAAFVLTALAIIIALMGAVFLLTVSHLSADQAKLSLSAYCKECALETSKPYDAIEMQMKCTKYVGRQVNWKAHVKSTSAILRGNSAMNLVQSFPHWAQSLIKCIFGKTDEKEFFRAVLSDTCYMSSYNTYSVSVTTTLTCPASSSMQGKSQDVILQSDAKMLKHLKYLTPGTEILFNATLSKGLGTQRIFTDLHSIIFKEKVEEFQEDEPTHKILLKAIFQGFQFFIGPVIAWK